MRRQYRSGKGRYAVSEDVVLQDVDARGVATVTLNRPEVGNAYNAEMLDALIGVLGRLADDKTVRCLVIRGAGKHFQAGADIGWLNEVAHYPPAENFAASLATTRAMQLLNEFPKPTIALVHGACFGGGVGIVCCVDVAFATPDSIFGITEVRVGVSPTPISTHMINAIGLRHTRRYALTGERFGAREAERIGLVHEVVVEAETEAKLAAVVDAISLGGPEAIAMTKRSFLGANGLLLDERHMTLLAHEGWTQRASAEGHEGTSAFRDKRRPSWYRPMESLTKRE
jgi:methylglutaconyl-CoA hydratase